MMMRKRSGIVALLAGALLVSSGCVAAQEMFWGWMGLGTIKGASGVRPVDNKQYKEECGSCHFAYQPGLLPAKSWEKLLTAEALHNHFGDVADLDKDTLQVIHDYAVTYAADKSYYKVARKIAVSTKDGEAPLRIAEVRYIKRKHHEIPENMVKGNKDVKSLSYCSACHTQAEKGDFREDAVSIPHYADY
jgi:Dihaem cytochrome c